LWLRNARRKNCFFTSEIAVSSDIFKKASIIFIRIILTATLLSNGAGYGRKWGDEFKYQSHNEKLNFSTEAAILILKIILKIFK